MIKTHYSFEGLKIIKFLKIFSGFKSVTNFTKLLANIFLLSVYVEQEKLICLEQKFNLEKNSDVEKFLLDRTIFFLRSQFYNFLENIFYRVIFVSFLENYQITKKKNALKFYLYFNEMTKNFFFFQKSSFHNFKSFFRTFSLLHIFEKIVLKKEKKKTLKKKKYRTLRIFLKKKNLKSQTRFIFFIKNEFEIRMVTLLCMVLEHKNLRSIFNTFYYNQNCTKITRI